MKRKSLQYIQRTGDVPISWTYDARLTALANDALYFCRSRVNALQRISVYLSPDAPRSLGRCFWNVGIIRINKGSVILDTLAHEVAHFAYHSHGRRHADLTAKIEKYFKAIKA